MSNHPFTRIVVKVTAVFGLVIALWSARTILPAYAQGPCFVEYTGDNSADFSSADAGASWSLSNNGPANVSVEELVWYGTQTLFAGTHGRGVFVLALEAVRSRALGAGR